MTSDYLFVFAQAHHEFRIPELLSVAEIHQIALHLPENYDISRPFMIIGLEEESHAHILATRCILIKSIHQFFSQGRDYDELHKDNQTARARDLWSKYIHTSFKFSVTGYNHTISGDYQRNVMESFSYMEYLGKIDMKNPEIILSCYEEFTDPRGRDIEEVKQDKPIHIYFGRLLVNGTARFLIKTFDVKKRKYFGNTSMEAEMSLLMANQALAAPGKLIYDPFVGTGSMLYTSAHFGSLMFGSDIDGRQMRGKEQEPGILRAANQYGVKNRIIGGLVTFDVTKNPWRCGELFDAIVTDPPYGVRAGAKRLGRKVPRPVSRPHVPRPDDQPYLPPTRPYELSNLVYDLIRLARYLLKPRGRLVFFLPTVTDEYEDVDIHDVLCEGMEIDANSLQDFGAWGRRLVTIRKTTNKQYEPPAFEDSRIETAGLVEELSDDLKREPAHKDFREKYFQGFKKAE